jgi:hypothetical protein
MAAPLSNCIPYVKTASVSQILAFPTSLAALKAPVRWTASCWVTDRRLDQLELLWVGEHVFPGQHRIPHFEWCHFASDSESQISLLVIFPNLRSNFRSEEVMAKWTDEIVIPAFQKHGVSAGILSTSFNVIRMTAGAEREETLNQNAPDTALREVLAKRGGVVEEDLDGIWTSIKEIANGNAFWGFRELFLVATHHQTSGVHDGQLSIEDGWKLASGAWDSAVDMKYVPIKSIRAHARMSLGATLPTPSGISSPIQSPTSRATFQNMAPLELSRKRRNDDENVSPKRSKFEGDARPVLTAFGMFKSIFSGNTRV